MFEKRTPLHVAARLGLDSISSILLKDPNVNPIACDDNGMHPAHIAATHDHAGTLGQLLGHANSEVNAMDSFGWTSLHWAAFNGATACVECLMKGGASLTAKGVPRGLVLTTPSEMAREQGHDAIADMCAVPGEDAHARGGGGQKVAKPSLL
jgi:ankyrin repeat protein